MSLPMLICERISALVGTSELTHVENIADLPRHLHLLEFLLAEGADTVAGEPLIQAWSADKCLAVSARCEVLQHVRADYTNELLENLFELGPRIFNSEFFQFVCRNGGSQLFINVCDHVGCPGERVLLSFLILIILIDGLLRLFLIFSFYHFVSVLGTRAIRRFDYSWIDILIERTRTQRENYN